MLHTLLALLLLGATLLLLATPGCGRNSAGEGASAIKPGLVTLKRVEKIEKAMASEDPWVSRRALLEALPLVAAQPRVTRSILHGLRSARLDKDLHMLSVLVLGNARGQSAEEVIREYAVASPDERSLILLALGRIGGEAAGAAPFLRKRLVDPQIVVGERAAIMIVLARMGQVSPQDMDEIAQGFAQKDFLDAAIETMFLVGPNDWLRGHVESALTGAWGASDDEESRLCMMATLSLLKGTNDKDAILTARQYFELQCKKFQVEGPTHARGGGGVIASGLLLAAQDPERRHDALRAVFATHYGTWLSRDLFWLPEVCISMARDVGFAKEVVSLVSDPDPHVATEAAYFLQLIGPPARAATPELLRLVGAANAAESQEMKDLRLAAAQALGMVAMPAEVPTIRELSLKLGLPPNLKRALDDSVRVIELGV